MNRTDTYQAIVEVPQDAPDPHLVVEDYLGIRHSGAIKLADLGPNGGVMWLIYSAPREQLVAEVPISREVVAMVDANRAGFARILEADLMAAVDRLFETPVDEAFQALGIVARDSAAELEELARHVKIVAANPGDGKYRGPRSRNRWANPGGMK